jgi:hypothetical protein
MGNGPSAKPIKTITNWTPVGFSFTATQSNIDLACRLGYYSNTVTGKVYFYNVKLIKNPAAQ